MRTLLVTGASGFLGWHVCAAARRSGWRVVGMTHSHGAALEEVDMRACDLRDPAALERLVADVSPDAVAHLAAVSQPNACEHDPAGTAALNVGASLHLAAFCAARRIPLAFTSSDLVFDGARAPYRETDPVGPVNEYGRQKVTAETGIRQRHPAAVICRMPLMFGPAAGSGRSFVQPLVEALTRGQQVRLFVDEYRTPVSGRDAAAGILAALERGAGGVYHLGGRERISRYEFGLALARLMHAPESLVVPVRQRDIPMAAARPPDVSLDSSLAHRELGYAPAMIEHELQALLETET